MYLLHKQIISHPQLVLHIYHFCLSSFFFFSFQEYDFVFTIDVQEGAPPLKLPFNTNQDPYHVAQEFLQKHELTPQYLDQVADFIIKNSGTTAPPMNITMSDPYTGKYNEFKNYWKLQFHCNIYLYTWKVEIDIIIIYIDIDRQIHI